MYSNVKYCSVYYLQTKSKFDVSVLQFVDETEWQSWADGLVSPHSFVTCSGCFHELKWYSVVTDKNRLYVRM